MSETFFTVEIDRQGPDKMFRRALPQNIALGRMLEMGNLLGGVGLRAGWQRVGSTFGDDLFAMADIGCGITTPLRFTPPGLRSDAAAALLPGQTKVALAPGEHTA